MGITAALGVGSALLSNKASKKQAKAQNAAIAASTTELPVYSGFGAGGVGGGLGFQQPNQQFSFDQLINNVPQHLRAQAMEQAQTTAAAQPQAPVTAPGQQNLFTPDNLAAFEKAKQRYNLWSNSDNASSFPDFGAWVSGATPGGFANQRPELSFQGMQESGAIPQQGAAAASGTANGSGVAPTGGAAGGVPGFGNFGGPSDQVGFGLGDLDPSRQGLVNLAQQSIGRAGKAGQGLSPELQGQAQQFFNTPTAARDPNAGLLQQQLRQQQNVGQQALRNIGQANAPSAPVNFLQRVAGQGALQGMRQAMQGGDRQTARTLDLLRQQAQPHEARAFQGLQDQQFATGQMGTTGGGIQTEAFARGLGQADLSRQLAASQEGRAVTGEALQRAQGFGNQLQGFRGQQDDLVSSAFDRFQSTQEQLGGLGQRQFARGQEINQLNRQGGLQNLQTQMGLESFVPQLQQAHLGGANQALQSQAGLQSQSIEPFNAALSLAQAQANAKIGAGSNIAAIASKANFGAPQQFQANLLAGIGEKTKGMSFGDLGDKISGLFS